MKARHQAQPIDAMRMCQIMLLAALAASAGATSALMSAETCDLENVAYLQTRNLQGSQLGVATHCTNGINSGNCGRYQCTNCYPIYPAIPGTLIPFNNANGWDQGFLECKNLPRTVGTGFGTSCTIPSSLTSFYIFEDSDDYLVCDGYMTCIRWKVKNVGAVCCSGHQTCTENRIFLNNGNDPENPKGTCSNDLCCDGFESCRLSDFVGIGSISCRGQATCYNTLFDELSGDVWCSSESIVETTQTGPDTCGGLATGTDRSDFRFRAPDDSEHCVTCLGTGAIIMSAGTPCGASTPMAQKSS